MVSVNRNELWQCMIELVSSARGIERTSFGADLVKLFECIFPRSSIGMSEMRSRWSGLGMQEGGTLGIRVDY